jgi:putative hydrolase of the HAD superfamily
MRSNRFPIRYLTLDVTGTLLRPRQSIGKIYLLNWEIVTDKKLPIPVFEAGEKKISHDFPLIFSALSKNYPNFGRDSLRRKDDKDTAFTWWSELIIRVMPKEATGTIDKKNRDLLTHSLYQYYAKADAWEVYPEVVDVLKTLQAFDVKIGAISNFDERLPSILQDLGLYDYFDVITTSWEHGHMKPDVSIFLDTFQKLTKHRNFNSDDRIMHVGDHVERDYKGALKTGAKSLLLDRHNKYVHQVTIPSQHIIHSLDELFEID